VSDELPHPDAELFLASIQMQLGCSAIQAAQAMASTIRTPFGEL